jgi:hypothetical protein
LVFGGHIDMSRRGGAALESLDKAASNLRHRRMPRRDRNRVRVRVRASHGAEHSPYPESPAPLRYFPPLFTLLA